MNLKFILFVGILFASSMSDAMQLSTSCKCYTTYFQPETEPIPRPASNVKICQLPLKYDAKREMYYYGRCLDEIPAREFSNREPIENSDRGVGWALDSTGPAKRYIATEPLTTPPSIFTTILSYFFGKKQLPTSESICKPEALLASKDRRTKINKPGEYPWRVHGQVEMEYTADNETYIGSGTLIGNKYVLTAGHNLYDREKRKPPTVVTFYPGRDGKTEPWQSKASKFVVHHRYVNERMEGEAQENDIGVITLSEPLGNEVGYFGTIVLDDSEFNNLMFNITGYPGEKNRHMYTAAGKMAMAAPQRLIYDIDTTGGQSGSAIYSTGPEAAPSDSEKHPYCAFCAGVHTSGGYEYNSGTRMNQEKYGLVKEWTPKSLQHHNLKVP